MACRCQYNKEAIEYEKEVIAKLRELFIKRMTVNSPHNDRRRKDFNQAIFSWWDDNESHLPERATAVWSNMTMDMVLRCFDDATKDWRKTWCDVENCTRK